MISRRSTQREGADCTTMRESPGREAGSAILITVAGAPAEIAAMMA